ncbi:MFS transporter [Rhizomonospora bruguierae]|uniref:MFS transporter n=1 Tax=Rhizomonospora bruguierae TaxID=1581705 RepID=UPI001BCC009A|nr:MFS transporter [Micromonospora sp. NBRC 107566]
MRREDRRGRTVGRTVGTAIRAGRALARGTATTGRWAGRTVGEVRRKGAGGESGMARLFDLHAASCAGDTLITIGLAGTIFFSAPLGEARDKVGLYLLVTMVPFALLAPVVGPLLDHFRHGRRYALAATMLGRAFLAWLISDYIHGFGLYPAAFGVLALSRAYGVARSAAVPRLLPRGLGLSQAGARASVYGTVAGAVVAPLGVAAFQFGPQWPLRVATVIFVIGMVHALRLPPRADSDPPETVPRVFLAPWRRTGGEKVLTGRLVLATVAGSATLRALYGFLLLFLAFSIKAGDLPGTVLGMTFGEGFALSVVGGALGAGTFLATALGTRLNIHRPAALQATGLLLAAGAATLAALRFTLVTVALFCLVTALASGLAKLAVDATIQERIAERSRASAFAHAETVLMLAWVAGGGLGLIPMGGRVGLVAAAVFAALALLRAAAVAAGLRRERLNGRAAPEATEQRPADRSTAAPAADRPASRVGSDEPTLVDPRTTVPPVDPWSDAATAPSPAAPAPAPAPPLRAAGGGEEPARRRLRPFGRPTPKQGGPSGTPVPPAPDDDPLTPPGFHIYRPGARRPAGDDPAPKNRSGE